MNHVHSQERQALITPASSSLTASWQLPHWKIKQGPKFHKPSRAIPESGSFSSSPSSWDGKPLKSICLGLELFGIAERKQWEKKIFYSDSQAYACPSWKSNTNLKPREKLKGRICRLAELDLSSAVSGIKAFRKQEANPSFLSPGQSNFSPSYCNFKGFPQLMLPVSTKLHVPESTGQAEPWAPASRHLPTSSSQKWSHFSLYRQTATTCLSCGPSSVWPHKTSAYLLWWKQSVMRPRCFVPFGHPQGARKHSDWLARASSKTREMKCVCDSPLGPVLLDAALRHQGR